MRDKLKSTSALTAALVTTVLALTTVAMAQRAPGERGPTEHEGFGPDARPQREPLPPPRREREKAEQQKKAAEPPKPIPARIARPGSRGVPESGAERVKLLTELHAHLATAADEPSASRVAAAIEHVWRSTSSDTVNLLMERAQRASTEKKYEMAVRLLDRAAQLSPDNPEVFRVRAAVNYARDDMGACIADLRRTIALEPNHFKALEMLGSIFKELGRKKAALAFYRKLYEIHPQMSGVKSAFEELDREVLGQAG